MARLPPHRQALLVSAVLMAGNASSYLFTIVAARLLVPDAFGELSALMAVLVVGVVPAMSAQTGIALHVAERVGRRGEGRAALGGSLGLGLALGGGVAGLGLAAAPALVALLHLPGPRAALLLPLVLLPFPVAGALCGVLQGLRRFGALALLLGLETVGRAGGGLVGLLVGRSPASALIGLAIGMAGATVAGWLLCGRPRPALASRQLTRKVVHAVAATVGLVLLLNLGVVLARHVLPGDRSGLYAVGLILGKIAYWLPQAVGVMVLPRLAEPAGRRGAVLLAVGVVLGVDAPVVLAGWLFGPELLPLIGGSRYGGEPAPLWLFALTGSLLAAAQILLYSRIARADLRSIIAVWLAVGVEVGLVRLWLGDSVGEVATAAAIAAALLVTAGITVELRRDGGGTVELRRDGGVEVDAAGDTHGAGGDPGADGHEHRGLRDRPVRPGLPLARQPSDDRDHGGREGAGERDPGDHPGPQLPHQRTGDEQHHRQHSGERRDEHDGEHGGPVPAGGGRGEHADAAASQHRHRGQHDGD